MKGPTEGRRKAVAVAGVTSLVYFGSLLILALDPVQLLPLDNKPALVLFICLGLPTMALVGSMLWHWSQGIAADLAYRDDMTGLPNRRAFLADATALMKNAKTGSAALVLLDVDRLKRLNDTCGHQAGDELIRLAGRQLLQAAGRNGTVYRVGGDEFAILVNRAGGSRLSPVLAALSSMERRFHTCNHAHEISLSAGYASCAEGERFESLFKRADQRLYQSKEPSLQVQAAGATVPVASSSVESFGFAVTDARLSLIHSRD